MKKNRMMRLASVLLVLTLLTSSMISGTFAKYVSADEDSDTARVAKWGVTASISGSLFGKSCEHVTEDGGNEISASATDMTVAVADSDESMIVAPGTQNTDGLILSVTGMPEVANIVSVTTGDPDAAGKPVDIYLKDGTYATLVKVEGVTESNKTDYYVLDTADQNYRKVGADDAVGADTDYYALYDVVDLTADYYPITWTLTEEDDTADAGNPDTYDTIADLYKAIEEVFNTGTTNDGHNDPNDPLDASCKITWAWAFADADDTTKDPADTILGNLIAAESDAADPDATAPDQIVVQSDATGTDTWKAIKEENYNTTVAFDITLTVTQVD